MARPHLGGLLVLALLAGCATGTPDETGSTTAADRAVTPPATALGVRGLPVTLAVDEGGRTVSGRSANSTPRSFSS